MNRLTTDAVFKDSGNTIFESDSWSHQNQLGESWPNDFVEMANRGEDLGGYGQDALWQVQSQYISKTWNFLFIYYLSIFIFIFIHIFFCFFSLHSEKKDELYTLEEKMAEAKRNKVAVAPKAAPSKKKLRFMGGGTFVVGPVGGNYF